MLRKPSAFEVIKRKSFTASLPSPSGIEAVGERPFIFRLLHFAGGALQVFVCWNARGKNSCRIPVVLVGFKS
jgi:hypothetical protein